MGSSEARSEGRSNQPGIQIYIEVKVILKPVRLGYVCLCTVVLIRLSNGSKWPLEHVITLHSGKCVVCR